MKMRGNHIISELIVSASEIIFSLNVCRIVAVQTFVSGPVTTHRIRGAVVLYLNIAILFGVIDSMIASLIPDAYANLPKGNYDTIGSMVYFSLITLTTTSNAGSSFRAQPCRARSRYRPVLYGNTDSKFDRTSRFQPT